MKTTIMKPTTPVRNLDTRVRYRAATTVSSSYDDRPRQVIGFNKMHRFVITHCTIVCNEYPTHLHVQVTNIEQQHEETHIIVDIIVTPRMIYASSYDTRGECPAQYQRISEPHNSGIKFYTAFKPKTVINLQNGKRTKTLTPAIDAVIGRMLEAHETCGYTVSQTWGESEQRMYAREWIRPDTPRKRMDCRPLSLFDVRNPEQESCVWDEQEWLDYAQPSIDGDVVFDASIFRDATPYFIGDDVRTGVHRILEYTLTKPTQEAVDGLLEQNENARTITQQQATPSSNTQDTERTLSDIILMMERTFITGNAKHEYVDNRGYIREHHTEEDAM